MSLRGKRDIAATAALKREGYFVDKDSFLGLPDDKHVAHFYLEGEDRSEARRKLVKKAFRGKKSPVCALCHNFISEWHDFEMDHVEDGLGAQRCDCQHNLRLVHRDCHRKKHVHVQWTPKTEVA